LKTIVFVLVVFCVVVQGEHRTGRCGDTVKYDLDLDTGKLILSGTGYMNSRRCFSGWSGILDVVIEDGVLSVAEANFYNCAYLRSVVIGDTVQEIEESAFQGCDHLESVTIGKSVRTIGRDAFSGSALKQVTIPGSVTSIDGFNNCKQLESVKMEESANKVTINMMAFQKSGLKSVIIPSSVTVIGEEAFAECQQLENVVFEESENELIIRMKAFLNSGLKSVTIPNSVTKIDDQTFAGCGQLENVTIGNSVKTIGYQAFNGNGIKQLILGNSLETIGYSAFGGCSLSSVTIPDSVTSIGEYAFGDCKHLVSVIVGESVETIENSAFSGCNSLQSVTLGSSLKTIGSSVFYECILLPSITIPKSVTSIDSSSFVKCWKLERIDVEEGNENYESVDGVLFDKGGKALIRFPSALNRLSYTIPDTVESVYSYAFQGNKFLRNVTIPNGVKAIGESVFFNCEELEYVAYFGTTSPGSGDSFYQNPNLIAVCVPANYKSSSFCQWSRLSPLSKCGYEPREIGSCGFGTVWYLDSETGVLTVKGNGDMKDACDFTEDRKKLVTSVVIEDGVESIAPKAFINLVNMSSLTIAKTVQTIGDEAFQNCFIYGLQSVVTIPDSVKSIGKRAFAESGVKQVILGSSLQTIGDGAFAFCDSLSSITIPKSVTSIGDQTFVSCQSMSRIDVEDGNNNFESVDGVLFNKGRTKLVQYAIQKTGKSYTIPDTVVEIGSCAFEMNHYLQDVTITGNVTTIGPDAFAFCSQLRTVTISASVTPFTLTLFMIVLR